ncbi:hypothetical protein HanRHA438_Chr15g0691891 [Helianthus annuus]|nr:hypothetical protein HanPSC8_Chr15g0651651 [Helianthus annuus]KAJ0843491.1 hypothetical protein HanRHA438_Chr15g0691891 [Helianthus annuus]
MAEHLIFEVRDLASWTVIDVGTGNGLLQELAKQGCVGLLNVDGYYSSLLLFIDKAVE